MHKLLGHELTWVSDYRYKLLLRGAKLNYLGCLGTAVKRKAPITPRLLGCRKTKTEPKTAQRVVQGYFRDAYCD